MKLFFIVLYVLSKSTDCAPSGRRADALAAHEAAQNISMTASTTVPPISCMFGTQHKSPEEKQDRPTTAKVSTNCGGAIKTFREANNQKLTDLYGSSSVMDLILCRGAAMCNVKPEELQARSEKSFICDNHIQELATHWSDAIRKHALTRKTAEGKKEVCSMPSQVGFQHTVRPIATGKNIQHVYKDETQMILKEYNILVPPGTVICANHKQFLQEKIDATSDQGSTSSSADEKMDVDEESCEEDSDYVPPTSHKKKCSTAQTQLQKFAGMMNIHKVASAKPFGELSAASKNKKVCAARRLFDAVLSTMVPGNTDEFKHLVVHNDLESWSSKKDNKFTELMEYIAESFRNAQNRAERYTILSMVAKTLTLSQIRVFIPGLSYHVYNVARNFKRFQIDEKRKVERYFPVGINHFIEFITSNVIMSPYTFGTLRTKTSTGTIVHLPKTIRKQTASEIIEMYKVILKEVGEEHNLMADSTYYRILNVCSAVTQKASTCVDYFIVDGMEAADDLIEIFSQWQTKGLIDEATQKRLVHDIEESMHYFRTDYRLHIKTQSRTPDHCGHFALSDPDDENLAEKCDHEHDVQCDRCEKAEQVFLEVQTLVESLIDTAQKKMKKTKSQLLKLSLDALENNREDIEEALAKIRELKRHLLRAKITDNQRTDIVLALNENEALLTLDFAQKLLPQHYKEKQTDYFAKRGHCWHVTHVTANMSNHIVSHSFVHLLDGEKQDTEAVTAIISHSLKELHVMGIKKVFLRSDNAGKSTKLLPQFPERFTGCYHSAPTIGSLLEIASKTGVAIERYSFSEPQNGKSHCDRVASVVKRKVHTYVDAGNDVITVEDFFNAITLKKPLKGISVFRGRINSPQVLAKDRTKIKDINSYYDFVFTKTTVTMHRYSGIGKGTTAKTGDFKPNQSTFIVESKGGFLAAEGLKDSEKEKLEKGEIPQFWYNRKCATSICLDEATEVKDILTEDDQMENSETEGGTYFRCPTPGCSASYRQYRNLEKHVLIGKHNIAPERLTLRDYALQKFVAKLEEVDNSKNEDDLKSTEVKDALNALPKSLGNRVVEKGWALKPKRICGRFSDTVRTYLTERFMEGETSGKKSTGDDVVKKMKNEKNADGTRKFVKSDKVTSKQINSFFSRMNKERNADSTIRTIRSDSGSESGSESGMEVDQKQDSEESDDEIENDEYSDAYILEGFKDPLYYTSFDIEIRKEVRKLENLFDMTLDIRVNPEDVDSPLLEKQKKAKAPKT